MATKQINWTLLAGAMLAEYVPLIYKQFLVKAPLYRFLSVETGKGNPHTFDVEFEGDEAGTFADGDSTYADGIFGKSDIPKGSLTWANYASGFEITEPAATHAATAQGPSDLVNLWIGNKTRTARRLVKKIAKKTYDGDGTSDNMTGLDNVIKSTGNYAGIDVATYTKWVSYVSEAGGTLRAFDPKMLDNGVFEVETACGEQPNLIVTGIPGWKKLSQHFRSWRQDWAFTAGEQVKVTMGVDMLEYTSGIPILKDPNCSANRIYFLNTNYLKVRYKTPRFAGPNTIIAYEPNVELKADGQTAGLQESLRMMFGLHIPATQGPLSQGVVLGHPLLECNNRAAQGVVKDIDFSA